MNMRAVQEIKPVHRMPMSHQTNTINQQAAFEINDIFKALKIIFPSSFKSNYPDDMSLQQGKKMWVRAFIENSVSNEEQIKCAMRKARLHGEFMPTIGTFIGWCKPSAEEMGLPSAERAYREACCKVRDYGSAVYSHVAVKLATKETGTWLLKQYPAYQSRPIFMKHYAQLVERVLRGELLSAPLPALPEKIEYRKPSKEIEDHYLAIIKALVRL